MLVTRIFSFSHNVFKRLFFFQGFQGSYKSGLCGKELRFILYQKIEDFIKRVKTFFKTL